MTTPKVSIITATYNWSSVLRYAIQSVLWQSFQDFEYLIIGDACTDDSAEVVASFNDPRLRWHNLPENSGSQSVPNNAGLQMAQGNYVAYLGHDDIWHPAHLESLVKVMDSTNVDLACAVTAWIGAPGTGIRQVSGLGPHRSIHGKPPPSSIMHRWDVLEQTGTWKDFRTIHALPDQEFISRVWDFRGRFASTGKLTTFKFPAAWRTNSYREKRSDEQAEYVRRIQAEPDFLEKEWLEVVLAFASNKHIAPQLQPPRNAAPGWWVDQLRKAKGLSPMPALAPVPSGAQSSPLKRLTRSVKSLLRRVLRKVLHMLREN